MPKINAGSNATVSLTAGQVISVSAGGGLIRFEFPAGTVLFEGDGVDQTFGPYSSSGNCVITSLIGAIDYSVSTPPGSVAPYVPSNVDIRGGVINSVPVSSIAAGRQLAPLRIATFGDSTANISGIAQQDLTAYNPAFPASGATVTGVSVDKFSLPQLYPQAYLVGNGGISGDTTTGMLARDQSAASSSRKAVTDIINLRPDVVFLRGGSINDLMSVTAGTLAATVSAVYARHVQVISRLLAGGVIVIDEGIYGFTTGSNTPADLASTRSALTQLNALFATYASGFPGRVFFLSPTGLLSDATGAYLTGMSNDGTHLSQWGGYVLAGAERDLLNIAIGKPYGPRFRGVNCVANAMLASTSVLSYGTVATGFTVGVSNATRQNAQVETIDGRAWQTCEFVPTGGASPNGSIHMPYDPSTTSTLSPMNISAGDVFGFEFDFLIQGLNGAAPPTPTLILGRLDTTKTAAGRIVWDNLSPSTYGALQGTYMGKCVIGPWQITEPSANLATAPTADWYLSFTTADTVNGFKLGVSQPRIVKLGTALTVM